MVRKRVMEVFAGAGKLVLALIFTGFFGALSVVAFIRGSAVNALALLTLASLTFNVALFFLAYRAYRVRDKAIEERDAQPQVVIHEHQHEHKHVYPEGPRPEAGLKLPQESAGERKAD